MTQFGINELVNKNEGVGHDSVRVNRISQMSTDGITHLINKMSSGAIFPFLLGGSWPRHSQ